MQKGLRDDLVGDTIPYLSGTRTGFIANSKTYREKVLESIAKHMPPEPEPLPGGETSARSNGSQAVKIIEPPSVRALRDKIGKIQKVITENEAGKTVNGISLKKPLMLVAMPSEENEEESPTRVGQASKSTRMATSHNALRGSVDQR